MFQTFDDKAAPELGRERADRLREALSRHGLDGFVVPRADEHQGEYVPPHAERLAWLTGFTGSAGMAIVLKDKAAIFVDGRYTLQVRDQVDIDVFEPHHLIQEPPGRWIEETLRHGGRLGYDPKLHTMAAADRLKSAAQKAGGELVPCNDNLVDEIWEDQPPPPLAPVVPHPIAHAGEASAAKLQRIAEALEMADADATVLTQPDSIAWLFNIRGGDVGHTPLPLSYAIVHSDGTAELFIDDRKLGAETKRHLGNVVTLRPPARLGGALEEMAESGRTVRLDPSSASDWVRRRLEGAEITTGDDPCLLPKATKNAAEIEGTREAHIRDGAAVSRFLAWLAREAPRGSVDEIKAAKRLEAFRAETGALKDLSFDTISGSGPNGAIVHYRVTERTNRPLEPGDLYLVDSGAQYVDGTTDVTRTVAVGAPGAEECDRFTRVLKGHIAIATARFPEGTNGAQLDTLARMALWQAGLDFDHGTGHGVGSYLSVHEGPQRISKLGAAPLRAGMIVSNEPGYYKQGAYGIRIENLVLVTEAEEIDDGERPMHAFETLTLAPIDRALIVPERLTADERDWLDAYHARVRDTLSDKVDAETRVWLQEATAPL